MVHGKYFIVV